MSNIRTYSLLNFKFLLRFIFIIFLMLFFPLMIYGNAVVLSGFWNNNLKAGFFGIFLLGINFYLFYYFGLVIYQFARYFWHERTTKIEIDYSIETITIIKNSSEYVVDSSNLELIEFHLSTKNYKNLLHNFGYTKFICHDKTEFIITNFVLDYALVQNMFYSKKKIKKLAEVVYLP